MKFLLLFSVLMPALFGFSESIYSFSGSFEQHIVDDQNKTIIYHGHVWAKRPDKALWEYSDPIKKSVYVHGHRVIVVEPDLEQAIIKTISSDIDLFALIASAKPIGNETYEAHYADQIFTIKLMHGVIERIDYLDPFENSVNLIFSNQEQNKRIDDEKFFARIPKAYDIIKDR
jgi:outer membrane lipoprotein carrier protein